MSSSDESADIEPTCVSVGTLFWSAVSQLTVEVPFVLRFTCLGVLITAVIVIFTPSWYRASTRVMPPDQQNLTSTAMLAAGVMGAGGGGGLSSTAASLLGMRSPGSQLIGVLKSHRVADAIIDRFHLEQVYRRRGREQTREVLSANSMFVEDRTAGLLTINVTDSQPQRAASIANAYVEELNRLLLEINVSGAHRRRTFLQERLKQVTVDLEAAENELSKFSSKNAALDPAMQGKSMLDAAAALEGQLIAEKAQLQGLEQTYAGQSVRILASKARIAELERQLGRITGNDNDAVQSDSAYPAIRKLPLLSTMYSDLYRRARVQQVVFETLTKQYELTKIEEAEDTPSVAVLDLAEVPGRKAGPPRMPCILLAVAAFSILAALIVLLENSYRSLDDLHPAKMLLCRLSGRQKNTRSGSKYLPTRAAVSVRSIWELIRFGRFGYPNQYFPQL